jgi:hypothetical protein
VVLLPVVQVNIKLTDAEFEVLERRAKKEKVTPADHLRVCMLVDAVVSGDVGAFKITGQRMREKFVRRLGEWQRKGVMTL